MRASIQRFPGYGIALRYCVLAIPQYGALKLSATRHTHTRHELPIPQSAGPPARYRLDRTETTDTPVSAPHLKPTSAVERRGAREPFKLTPKRRSAAAAAAAVAGSSMTTGFPHGTSRCTISVVMHRSPRPWHRQI